MPYFEICKQTRKLIALRFLLLLWNWDVEWCLKIKPNLENTQTKFCRFLFLIEMTFLFNSEWVNRNPGRHVVTSVSSHANQEYPRISLDREPIRAREKHFTGLVYVNVVYCVM